MLIFPEIKPYLFQIGPFQVRWYGLMYLVGFIASFLLVRYQVRKKSLPISMEDIENLYFYLILGLIIGARAGYVIFYNLPYYIHNPLDLLAIWKGGMSFHGGLAGSVLGGILFCRKTGVDFWAIVDPIAVTAPIGLGLGRIGNFINAELYGRPTVLPWGMIFPGAGPFPRHPSQLYEAFFEGVLLFVLLWIAKDRIKVRGGLLPLFLIFYGVFRFFIEMVREPDVQVGYIAGILTMGQILCITMIAGGVLLFMYLKNRGERPEPVQKVSRGKGGKGKIRRKEP